MTICDVCDAKVVTERVNIKIQKQSTAGVQETTFDLCEKCIDYLSFNTFVIGIKEIRKHEQKGN